MYPPQTEKIRQGLLAVQAAGDFVASFDISAMGLTLRVEGVGPVRLPPTPEQLSRLLERAEPSPFGYRDQTLHDPGVRRATEVAGSDVRLESETWSVRLQRGVDHIVEGLGLSGDLQIEASLEKLVLYEAGGFFAPHRDTERDPSVRGSLVVVLPSSYQGGALVVSHAGERRTFDTSADSAARRLSFVGFYADCVHEIRPVEAGCRVALIFSLRARPAMRSSPPEHHRAVLRGHLSSFFDRGEPWLVLLLDHSYTRQQLDWDALKNLDRARVEALRHAASALDCACFLALADVQDWFEYDDEAGGVITRDGFGARTGGQLVLSGWRDASGRPCLGTDEVAEDPCIVSMVSPLQRHPYQLDGEVWTGNEGGTAAQWYHQAAVVVVPRASPLHGSVSEPVPPPPARRVIRRRKKVD